MQDVELINHRYNKDGNIEVHLQEKHGAQRDAWVAEGTVSQDLLDNYFNRAGASKLAAKLNKRRREPSSEPQVVATTGSTLMQLSEKADLESVACTTHKEGGAQATLAKSAGLLCACLSSGLIIHTQEVFGSESLSQRYMCVAAIKALLPEMQILIHDDACHLHKYAQRRMEARDVLFCTLFYSAFLLYFPSCFIDPISLLLFGRIQQQLLRFLLQLCGSSATLFTCKVMWTSGAKGHVIRDCPSTRRHCPGLGPACVNSLSHGYLHTSTKRSI